MSAWGRMLIFCPAIKAFTISHCIHIARGSVFSQRYHEMHRKDTEPHTHAAHARLVPAQTPYTVSASMLSFWRGNAGCKWRFGRVSNLRCPAVVKAVVWPLPFPVKSYRGDASSCQRESGTLFYLQRLRAYSAEPFSLTTAARVPPECRGLLPLWAPRRDLSFRQY